MNPEAYGSINERIFKLMHLHQREAAAILAVVGLDDISTNTTAGLVRQQPSLKRRRAAYSSNTSPNTYGHTSCINIRSIALESITSVT